jgi:hypothetical protein
MLATPTESFLPGKIPLKRLLDSYQSLPFTLTELSVYQGHDYGNLFVLEDQGLYPWEDSLVEDSYRTATILYAEDPHSTHDTPALLPMRTEYPMGCWG